MLESARPTVLSFLAYSVIVYDLICAQEHRFEGWFRSPEDFSAQKDGGLLICPHCGSREVRCLPAGLHRGAGASTPDTPAATPVAPSATAGQFASASPMALLREMVSALKAGSEDVGPRFAEEARRIHYAEAPARTIRGQASNEDFQALQEEGIDVFRLPDVGKDKLN